jgi:pSer/pThr/pTyr-binding forkhead associated (FHA) protein
MVNPPGFRFCGRCGQPLEAPAAAPPEDVGTAQTMFVGNAKDAMAELAREDARAEEAPPSNLAPPAMGPASAGAPPDAASDGPPQGMTAHGPGAAGQAKLVMLGTDGQAIGERVLAMGEALEIGRAAGPPWEDDAYLDPKHGTLTPVDDGVEIEDFGSVNGVFVKLTGRMDVQHGDQFRVGQELLRYEDLPEPTPTENGTERMGSPNPGYWGRLCTMVDPERASTAYPIEGEGITIGRELGDITFPQDGYVSGRHCRVMGDDDGIYIEDTGSSNGTYMRVRSGQTVPYGSYVLIGQKLFQVERTDG